jgi:hypothetical protein
MLKASGWAADCGATVFDMSVGYDLAGIRSARVRAFMAGLIDASAIVARLRAQIPDAFAQFRDTPFTTRISDTVTLSTFHGCPPQEIEDIAAFLLRDIGLHVVVKLNPTLLGESDRDSAPAAGISRTQRAGCSLRQGRDLAAGDGFRRPARHFGASARAWVRREIFQHLAGR